MSPRLSLHVPEPSVRPGGKPDFGHVGVPEAGEARRPPIDVDARRNPRPRLFADPRPRRQRRGGRRLGGRRSTPSELRQGLRDMMLTRAYDERMLLSQRQGKTSFYIQCTRRGGDRLRPSQGARARRHVLSDLSPAGPADRRRLAAGRHDVPDLLQRERPAEGPPASRSLFGARRPASSPSPAISARSIRRRSAGRWPRRSRATTQIASGWIGDGSTAESDFHSALVFASVYRAPVILNIVNNQWAISSYQGIAGGESAKFAARAPRLRHRLAARRRQRLSARSTPPRNGRPSGRAPISGRR